MANPDERGELLKLELRYLRLQSERHAAVSHVRAADLRLAHVVAEYAAVARTSRPAAAAQLARLVEPNAMAAT